MSPVPVSADKRFHRAHVKPRRRVRWRTFVLPVLKYAAVTVLALIVVYRGTALLARTRLLRIDRIVVHGNERLSERDVLALLHGLPGENLVLTNLDAYRRQLLASRWVRDASLRRSLPATIEVVVAERQAIGIGRVNGNLFLVDEAGGVIDAYGPQYAELDLPIIDGLNTTTGGAGAKDARARLAARLMVALRARPQVANRVSQIDVRDLHNAAVILNGDPATIYVGEDRFLPRLESYLELATAVRERVADIDYVDLRFDERIYVRPIQARRR
jgi:cell division protein FtsQ